jgi:hypothetical protein
VQDFFHKRVQVFLDIIAKTLFGMKHYWGRMEFSKLRGQIHIHLVGIIEGATELGGIQYQMFIHRENASKQVQILAEWARKTFNLTAEIEDGTEERLIDSPCSQKLSECTNVFTDGVDLCHFCQLHQCSDYCLRQSSSKISKQRCRMGCGEEYPAASGKTPGWEITSKDLIIEVLRGFKKLSLKRNHPRLLQTSLYCLQAWRANCDVSIMIYNSDPAFPDLAEIAEVIDYVVSYACKGNIAYSLEREQLKDFSRRLVLVSSIMYFISYSLLIIGCV